MKREMEQKFNEKFTFFDDKVGKRRLYTNTTLSDDIKQFINKHFINKNNLKEYLEKRIVEKNNGTINPTIK